MTDAAPERIWLDGDAEAGDGQFPRCFEMPKYCSEPAVEYIRADTAQARIAELEAALGFYADRQKYAADRYELSGDSGFIARRALEAKP